MKASVLRPGADAKPTPISTLLRFFVPVLVSRLTTQVTAVVDTAVVGLAGPTELAALAPALAVTDTCEFVFIFLNVAATALVAASWSQKDLYESRSIVTHGVILAVASGIAVGVLALPMSQPAVTAIVGEDDPEVITAAVKYLRIRIAGLPLAALLVVLQSSLQGMRDAVTPMLAFVSGAMANGALDYLLCVYSGWGIAGAGVATLLARSLQVLVLGCVAYRRLSVPFTSAEDTSTAHSPSWKVIVSLRSMRKFGRLGFPVLAVLAGKLCAYNSMTYAAGARVIPDLAAHQVISSIFGISCKPGDALSQTALAFIPGTLAAGVGGGVNVTTNTRIMLMRLFVIAVIGTAVVSAGAVLACLGGSGAFTGDERVITTVQSVAGWLFASVAPHAHMMVAEGALLALEDTTFLVAAYAAMVPPFLGAMVLVRSHSLGVHGVWACMGGLQVVRLLLFAVRLAASFATQARERKGLPLLPSCFPYLSPSLAGAEGYTTKSWFDVAAASLSKWRQGLLRSFGVEEVDAQDSGLVTYPSSPKSERSSDTSKSSESTSQGGSQRSRMNARSLGSLNDAINTALSGCLPERDSTHTRNTVEMV
mmetsp:Transcript_6808/g.19839  ORF Transcript_6808/g.19839 Transcript_6808/m.19839 type:complete len:593 (+) Transcript_6808:56-1834(+)